MRTMPVIYVDVLIALNWLIDFLLLSAVARLSRAVVRRWRVVLAALFGGVCACMLLLPAFPTPIQMTVDVIIAALMVLLAFPFGSLRLFGKRTVLLFGVSAVFSGVVSLLAQWFPGESIVSHNGNLYMDISPIMLTVFALVSYGGIRLCEHLLRRRVPPGGEYRVTVMDGGNEAVCRALYDTGLHLKEPFSGAAVILMEGSLIDRWASEDVRRALRENGAHPRIRRVPYRTVGGEGLIPAVRPQMVRLCRLGERPRDITGVYIGVCDHLDRGEYEALIGSDCVERGGQ